MGLSSIRWESPFPYTLAFNLFKQHFEEINRSYWAFVPASNTIRKLAKTELEKENKDPKSFFLIPDDEDRHVESSYEGWKASYAKYMNYTRMNMIMLLSSCFETYLRTVVSLAFESKPGVLIGCRDAVDGATLLKHDITYGDPLDSEYRFKEAIEDVCHGDWTKRFSQFQKYFGVLPANVLGLQRDLDALRLTRNNLGHYLGRRKSDYEAPLLFRPLENPSVSHERILKSFKLIFNAAKAIDEYLQSNIIGTYDIIKRYFLALSEGEIGCDAGDSISHQFKKMIGQNDLPLLPKSYYKDFVAFCETNYIERREDCIFTKKVCVKEICRRLNESGIKIYSGGREVEFNRLYFIKLLEKEKLFDNPLYSKRTVDKKHQVHYLHSALLIDLITKKLESNSTLLDDLVTI